MCKYTKSGSSFAKQPFFYESFFYESFFHESLGWLFFMRKLVPFALEELWKRNAPDHDFEVFFFVDSTLLS